MKFVQIQHLDAVTCGLAGERGVLQLEATLEDIISGAYMVSERDADLICTAL
ncbi:hypothetical protein [Paenibacillus sp. YYML68]|uniref:hypothetical protein n=1 Tax=Paenibacillus sp. YYML68 TaxID=2909250 RepID=UPI0024936086|nr:hypothetical protein [Paenibacillus sp. YYML68]